MRLADCNQSCAKPVSAGEFHFCVFPRKYANVPPAAAALELRQSLKSRIRTPEMIDQVAECRRADIFAPYQPRPIEALTIAQQILQPSAPGTIATCLTSRQSSTPCQWQVGGCLKNA
jgi:hypothetical protein